MPGSSSASEPRVQRGARRCALVLGLALGLLTTPVQADSSQATTAGGLLAEPQLDLRTGERRHIVPERDALTLLFLFEPQCRWCIAQSRELRALLSPDMSSGGHPASEPPSAAQPMRRLQLVALGVNGDRSALLDMLWRLKWQGPAFAATPGLLQQLGGVPATPLLVLLDSDGGYVAHFRGLTRASTLYPLLRGEAA